MHDVMRKRLWRKIEALPDEQIYQVLDYIEFLEAKYAREQSMEPTGFQRFAERFEDRMRKRRVAPAAIGGAMAAVSAATRIVDSVAGAGREVARFGRELLEEPEERRPATTASGTRSGAAAAGDAPTKRERNGPDERPAAEVNHRVPAPPPREDADA